MIYRLIHTFHFLPQLKNRKKIVNVFFTKELETFPNVAKHSIVFPFFDSSRKFPGKISDIIVLKEGQLIEIIVQHEQLIKTDRELKKLQNLFVNYVFEIKPTPS